MIGSLRLLKKPVRVNRQKTDAKNWRMKYRVGRLSPVFCYLLTDF
jgi:hypothetical protein